MEYFIRNISKRFFLKETAIIIFVALFSTIASVGLYCALNKQVTIICDGETRSFNTTDSTVRKAIRNRGIVLGEYDYVSAPLDSRLERTNEIVVKRAVPVYVVLDGKEKKVMTYMNTVEEVLQQEGVVLGEEDEIVGCALSDNIEKDMCIKVLRTIELYEIESEKIPFKVVEKENWDLGKGTRRVVRAGEDGVKENQYKVMLHGGVEIARQLIKSAVISVPVDEIIEFGTAATYRTSRGDVLRYRKVIDVKATAYTSSFKDTGKHPGHPEFGITYTGIKAKRGVIAVDPKVIPLGTKVYVEILGDMPDYGFAVAADIGGAIKGNKIDLYFEDEKTVEEWDNNWGWKWAKVYILN